MKVMKDTLVKNKVLDYNFSVLLILKEKNLINTIYLTVIDKDFQCDCCLTCSTMTVLMENYEILSPKIEDCENKLKKLKDKDHKHLINHQF